VDVGEFVQLAAVTAGRLKPHDSEEKKYYVSYKPSTPDIPITWEATSSPEAEISWDGSDCLRSKIDSSNELLQVGWALGGLLHVNTFTAERHSPHQISRHHGMVPGTSTLLVGCWSELMFTVSCTDTMDVLNLPIHVLHLRTHVLQAQYKKKDRELTAEDWVGSGRSKGIIPP
jgi:hypothetical protein